MHGIVSLVHGSKKSSIAPRVIQIDPSWANHRSPRAYMRQHTCLLYLNCNVPMPSISLARTQSWNQGQKENYGWYLSVHSTADMCGLNPGDEGPWISS